MKKYLTLAAAALLLVACSEKPGYEISGTVANADLNGPCPTQTRLRRGCRGTQTCRFRRERPFHKHIRIGKW